MGTEEKMLEIRMHQMRQMIKSGVKCGVQGDPQIMRL